MTIQEFLYLSPSDKAQFVYAAEQPILTGTKEDASRLFQFRELHAFIDRILLDIIDRDTDEHQGVVEYD